MQHYILRDKKGTQFVIFYCISYQSTSLLHSKSESEDKRQVYFIKQIYQKHYTSNFYIHVVSYGQTSLKDPKLKYTNKPKKLCPGSTTIPKTKDHDNI